MRTARSMPVQIPEPLGWAEWSPRERRRFHRIVRHVRRWFSWRRVNPRRREAVAVFARQYAAVARRDGLGASERSLRRYIRALTTGGPGYSALRDRRGGPGRLKPRAMRPSPTRELFERLLRDPLVPSVPHAWAIADETACRRGWPRFGLRAAQCHAARLPRAAVRVRSYQRGRSE